jgi:hypothetical protein
MYRLFEHVQFKLSDARPDSSSTAKTYISNSRQKFNDQPLGDTQQEDNQQALSMLPTPELTLDPSEGL